jgi:hypothetical protein
VVQGLKLHFGTQKSLERFGSREIDLEEGLKGFCTVRLCGLLLAVAALEALLELLDTTLGVQKALLTGPERMYTAPNVNRDLGFGRVRFHDDFAAVNDFAWDHLRMNVFFHVGS